MSKPIELVVAMDRRRGIGANGTLPWPRLPLDMSHFKEKTLSTSTTTPEGLQKEGVVAKFNAVVMGRKTWDSLPPQAQPLPGRINVVITSKPDELVYKRNDADKSIVVAVKSFEDAVAFADQADNVEKIVVIGGYQPFCDSLKSTRCTTIHLTEVLTGNYPCDVFLPPLPDCFEMVGDIKDLVMDGVNNNIPTQYFTYSRKAPSPQHLIQLATLPQTLEGEQGYLDLINYCIHYGKKCEDRTGVGTRSLFGNHIRYNLRHNSFPLFTTKRVFFRGVLKELLWFIKGSTDSNLLTNDKIHIWDGNSTREFLDKRGLSHRAVGDLGPVYGFQWRHFGAEYQDFNTDYSGKGFDQLSDLIHLIKTQPDSRRLIMSAWNPPQLNDMALPPCHVLCQFRVYDNKELHCLLYQRSCDLGLGVPFNVASYSLLTYMIAHLCGLVPGELVHVMGDIHVYNNHIEPLKEQLVRKPQQQPTLRIARPVVVVVAGTENTESVNTGDANEVTQNNVIRTIDDFVYEDFIVEGYKPDAPIKMDMAV